MAIPIFYTYAEIKSLLTDEDRELIKSAVKSGNLKNLNLIAILDKRQAERKEDETKTMPC